MRYVKLGNTGLDISPIALGCMTFGEPSRGYPTWTLPEDESRPLIRQAIEAGINSSTRQTPMVADAARRISGRGCVLAGPWCAIGFCSAAKSSIPSARVSTTLDCRDFILCNRSRAV